MCLLLLLLLYLDYIYYCCPCLKPIPGGGIFGFRKSLDPANIFDVFSSSSSIDNEAVDDNEVNPADDTREQVYEVYSTEQEAVEEIRKDGFETRFASKAEVVIEMEYQGGRMLCGNIKRVIGLKASEDEPIQDVRFHIKFNPSNKHKQKTEWKPVEDQLHMTTFFAKATRKQLDKNRLLVRMYGRKHRLSRERCFGQILIPLSKVTEKRKKWRKFIMPRSTPIDIIPRKGAFAAQVQNQVSAVPTTQQEAIEGNNDQPQEESTNIETSTKTDPAVEA